MPSKAPRFCVDNEPSAGDCEATIDLSLVELGQVIVSHLRPIALFTLAVTVVTASVMLLTPDQFTSRASILPSGQESGLSGILGLAGSFGAIGPDMVDDNSSVLYPSILRSDLVRDAVIENEYSLDVDNEHKVLSLADYFAQDDPGELRESLGRITAVQVDKKLGVITLNVTTARPELSQQVLQKHLTALEDYLVNKRKSQALQSADYLLHQQTACRLSLVDAEDSLQLYMAGNRNWATGDDPFLQTELARLRREVELKTQTYLLLAQQLEMARLDAQKDIPIVRILDQPSYPTQRSGPQRTMTTLFACLTALSLMVGYYLAVHVFKRGLHQGDLEAVQQLRDELRQGLRVPGRVLSMVKGARKDREERVSV
ncbi:MAG: GNVR domain-containing protein [bacterium]